MIHAAMTAFGFIATFGFGWVKGWVRHLRQWNPERASHAQTQRWPSVGQKDGGRFPKPTSQPEFFQQNGAEKDRKSTFPENGLELESFPAVDFLLPLENCTGQAAAFMARDGVFNRVGEGPGLPRWMATEKIPVW